MNIVLFNGVFSDGAIPLSANDRGLLLGDGIFETLMVANGTALWLKEHLQRMKMAADVLGFPLDLAQIEEAVGRVLARAPPGLHALRITLTRGSAARGLAGNGTPNLLVTLDPLPSGFLMQEVRLQTVSVRRNEWSPASSLKTVSYIDNVAAAREAAASGADDALMLNTAGNAACSTIANLFVLTGKELATPSIDQGILPGIMRKTLLENARQLGFEPVERAVRREELFAADGVFLTNSLRFVRPVPQLDGEALGTCDLGSLIDHLAVLAREQCGGDPRLI